MDEKSLLVLEFPKVLERLAGYAAFSASAELARALKPSPRLEEAQERLARTTEARLLLSINADISVGGTTDIRPLVDLAGRSGVLTPSDLLAVKTTLEVARNLARLFEKSKEQYPRMAFIALGLTPPPGIIESISRCISDKAEIRDTASDKLAVIRREVRIAHERLMTKLERMISDPKLVPILQEAIITQRNGRYVIPLRADFKGKIKSIVHDQSSSGATLFVEPISTVDMNNEWQEKQLAERDEERRILAELSAKIGEHADLLKGILESLAEFDLALACAKYAEDLHAAEPLLKPVKKTPNGKHPGSTIKLYQARHPLLDPETVVPIDLDLDEQTYALVITGPNTGGKTVTLKTLGLLSMMAQSGLHIPAQSGSELSCFTKVYADIGDEQSIEQSLSTFSGHITNIVRILRMADRSTLVLLDELGAGTDPQEGSALARAILANLVERGIPCLIATHYPELKAYAHGTPGVTNASVEFDLKTLRPTYHLTVGLPGRSNALAIAERLGLSYEIIQNARTMLDPTDLKAEDLLDEIHRQRDQARASRAAAETARLEAEKLQAELAARLEKVEDERQSLLEKSRSQAEEEVLQLRTELDALRKELTRARQPLEALKPLQEKVTALEAKTSEPVERRETLPIAHRPLKLGDRVHLRSLKTDGILTAMSEDEVEVQIGNLRVKAKTRDIQRKAGEEPVAEVEKTEPTLAGPSTIHPSPGMEIDLRGQMAEEALSALDSYIESAYLAGMPFVRIIHGKGTGKLRQVIREALRKMPQVSSWVTGHENEGGDGVTIARFSDHE